MAYDVKKRGGKVVLTHGAFDLFHYGHLHLLKESAKKGDFFIVGVESDSSIKTYKSEYRPIINESARIEIVSELHSVDGVFKLDYKELGGRDGYSNLYKEFNVDVLTIGRAFFAEDKVLNDLKKVKKSRLIKIDDDFEQTTAIIKRSYESYIKSRKQNKL
jgi:D-beta-D-heptose 7-phosphate kinase/D-beta-D-heptose 1-phosphate adenosyltransferase